MCPICLTTVVLGVIVSLIAWMRFKGTPVVKK